MRFLFVLLFAVLSVSASAESKFGYGVGFSSYGVDDPNGPTDTTTDSSFVNLYYFNEFARDSRYFLELYQADFRLDASTTNIGQEVEQLAFSGGYQKRFRFGKSFKPWAGFGGTYSQDKYTARHTVDNAGFLAATFPDRDEDMFSLFINAAIEYEINDKFDFGIIAKYTVPLDDGVEAIGINAIVTYDW